MALPHDPVSVPLPQAPSFAEPREDRRFPAAAVGIAGLAVVVLMTVLSLAGRHRAVGFSAHTPQAASPYASNLLLDGLAMSESTSLAGGKSTYIDGRITNRGPSTLTGVTVQVLFAGDTGMPPQVETESLSLIRTREPYVDTQPVSAAPLGPNGQADFRLIFENLSGSWNGQQPEIRIIAVTSR